MQKRALALSSRFEILKRRIQEDLDSQESIDRTRNKITLSLLEYVHECEIELNKNVEEASKAASEGDLHEAVFTIDKVFQVTKNNDLERYKFQLSKEIFHKSPSYKGKKDKSSFIWVFLITAMIASLLPAFIYKQHSVKASQSATSAQPLTSAMGILGINIGNESPADRRQSNEDILPDYFITYMLNFVLQIALLMCMVWYRIKPKVEVDQFIKEAPPFYKEKFNNDIDFKWFSERANESIKQFGRWLGFSFLGLYVLYYVYECLERLGVKLPAGYEEVTDVVVNGSEAFFLFILYRIITDDTIKPSTAKDKVFEPNLNHQAELGILVTMLFFYFLGILIFDQAPEKGVFFLISRTISGALVAVGLCLVIGRLDSKFIEPAKWELWILYLYAAIQLLFTLFDPVLVESAFSEPEQIFTEPVKKTLARYFDMVKMWVLYFILVLKGFFIYFVIKIHRKNYLFYYLLLGSKLNDEIKEGRKVKGYLR